MNPEPSGLSVHDLSFSYPDYPGLPARRLFHGLGFELPTGTMTVLLGAPDSGKTTLCRILMGLVPRFSGGTFDGRVVLQGRELDDSAPFELIELVGLVFQNPAEQLFASRCDLEVAFALESLGRDPREIQARVEEALDWMGLGAMRGRDPLTLSGGEKKKLLLACLHALDPSLWLLDETLDELDSTTRACLLDYLKSRRKTVLLPAAKWQELFGAYVDRVLLLDNGTVSPVAPRPGSEAFQELLSAAGLALPSGMRFDAPSRGAPQGIGTGAATDDPVRWGTLLEVRDLSFAYPDGGPFRLEVPHLEVRAGEVLALVGANGSGKTTLGRILCGLIEPQKGTVAVPEAGELSRAGPARLNRYTGYLFQDPDLQIFLPTVADELAYGLRLQGFGTEQIERSVADAVARFHLPGPEVPPALMSYGARKRLQAAVCHLLDRPVLVIDEGDSGLGAPEFARLLGEFRSPRRGLLFVTHDLELAERLAHRTIRLHDGRPQ